MGIHDTSGKHSDTGRLDVHAVEVDAEMLAFSTLTDIQYSDAHLLTANCTAERPAEQWARTIMEDVPADVRATLERAWQAIALRRAPAGTAHTVAGWPIVHTSPEYILLQAESVLGFKGQLLFRLGDSGILLATFVQFHDPGARTVWDRAVPAHLMLVRSLLDAQARTAPKPHGVTA
jgi:hypothetical protein